MAKYILKLNKKILLLFALSSILINCDYSKSKNSEKKIKKDLIADSDNGGLFMPDGFGAIVVSEGVGPSRHLAVKDNGDIYVKLRKASGRNGNVALRDNDGDGKADIVERFGDYPNDGKFGTVQDSFKRLRVFSSRN